jgi:hypothetical protein
MAGDQVCVLNDTGVSTGITISGIAGVFFSKTDRTAYGSSAGSFVGTAASGLEACFIARDTTHWVVTNTIGTWTAN